MKSRSGRIGVIVCVLSMLIPGGRRVAAQQIAGFAISGPSPWIDVKAYGATGIGSSANDDSAAIQAAVNACPTNGCTVFFPPGKYYVGTTITITQNSIVLRGAGFTSYNSTTASQIVSGAAIWLITAPGPLAQGPAIVDLGFADTSGSTNTVLGAVLLQGVSFFRLDNLACANITIGACIELDGNTSLSVVGYTQYGTITQLTTSNTKFGVQTNHKTSAIVMQGGVISCAPLGTTYSYITNSVGLDFAYNNHDLTTNGQNGEHFISGVSVNDCSIGGAFYDTAASRIFLKLEQTETPNKGTGTALLLDGKSGAGLTYDNELHIQASKTATGIYLGSVGTGVARTMIYDYARDAGGGTLNDIVVATAAILATTHISTPLVLYGSAVSGNQFPGPINLPDQSTPAPPPANTDTVFVNSGSTPADDLTVLHTSSTTVDLETHGVTAQGQVLVANSSSPAELAPLNLGGTNLYLKSNGTTVTYSTNPAGGTGSCSAGLFETASNADSAPTCADPNLVGWQDPGAAVSGNSPSDVTLYTTTLPAVPAGHGIRATVYFEHTLGSSAVIYRWKFGGGSPVSVSYTGNGSTNFMSASAVVFNSPASSSSQTLDAGTLLTGSTQLPGGETGDTEAWGTSSSLTISFAFDVGSGDQVTPKGWLVELIQ